MRRYLGISAYYHDSAAALVADGAIVAAAQEERFTRRKHDAAFPADAIRYCLDATELTLADVDGVVFYDKPWLKFERLLESYLANAPRGFKSFLAAMPIWLRKVDFPQRRQLAVPAAPRRRGGPLAHTVHAQHRRIGIG